MVGLTPPFRGTERFLKKPGGKVLRYHWKEGSLSLLLSSGLGDGQPTFAVWGSQHSPAVNGAPHVTLTSHTEGTMERKSWIPKSLDGCFALPELYPCVVINSFLSGRRLGVKLVGVSLQSAARQLLSHLERVGPLHVATGRTTG